MSTRKRDRASIVAAVRRVKLETLLTLDDLAKLVSRTIPELRAGVGPLSLKRWILEGKRGVYLDGIHTPGEGWKSSVEAVRRFVADVNATT